MPEIYSQIGQYISYECDHMHCHLPATPPLPPNRYSWCQDHTIQRLQASFESVKMAYRTERERLRLRPLAYYANHRPRASYLGPWDPSYPMAAETDLFVLHTWRDSATQLYRSITHLIKLQTDHAALFYRGDSHAGHDTEFPLFTQEQAQLLRQITELETLVSRRERYGT